MSGARCLGQHHFGRYHFVRRPETEPIRVDRKCQRGQISTQTPGVTRPTLWYDLGNSPIAKQDRIAEVRALRTPDLAMALRQYAMARHGHIWIFSRLALCSHRNFSPTVAFCRGSGTEPFFHSAKSVPSQNSWRVSSVMTSCPHSPHCPQQNTCNAPRKFVEFSHRFLIS